MRRSVLTILASLLAITAYGAPYLESDPVAVNANTALNPATYTITGNLPGTPIKFGATQVTVAGVSELQLVYDLGSIPNGTYTIQAYATNAAGESSQPTPNFIFSLGVPGTPLNLKITITP